MDKAVLDEYEAMLIESEDLQRRIRQTKQRIAELEATVVADSVEGTRPDGTYGSIKIKGIPLPAYDREILRLKHQKARYERLCGDIEGKRSAVEDFIDKLPESRIRTILRLRYLDRMTWEQISRKYGKSRTWSQMLVERFFARKA